MSFWYLATPYSKYPGGLEAAYIAACEQTGLLINAGVPVFSPIAHSHGPAIHARIPLTDHTIWLTADRPFMEAAWGLLVCMMPSWEKSHGIAEEIKFFCAAGKIVRYILHGAVPKILRESPNPGAWPPWQ
jgi:hypothetical protein